MFVFLMKAQHAQNQVLNQQSQIINYDEFLKLKRNDRAMADFLWDNDYAIYNQFKKGLKLKKTGKGLLFTGIGLTAGGFIIGLAGEEIYNYFKSSNSGESHDDLMMIIGVRCIISGTGFIITSIPILAVGRGMKNRAVNSYQEVYLRRRVGYQPSLDVKLTGNGVGLALMF
jgi:hypothetical protein